MWWQSPHPEAPAAMEPSRTKKWEEMGSWSQSWSRVVEHWLKLECVSRFSFVKSTTPDTGWIVKKRFIWLTDLV